MSTRPDLVARLCSPTKAFLPHQRVTTEGKAMKNFNIEVYLELRKDGYAAISALFYARHWSHNMHSQND